MAVAKAIAVIRPISAEGGAIEGTVRLLQRSDEALTRVNIKLRNVPAGTHGIRICCFGDESAGEASIGPIFNPLSKRHGDREDSDRSMGALGNVAPGEDGTVSLEFTDKHLKLIGPYSVIGRSFVVTAREDDVGKAAVLKASMDGNAGPPIAFGVIGISST